MYLVLFDIDGTLLNSGGCGRAATRLAIQDIFGTVGTLDEVSFAGRTDWEILNTALTPAGIPAAVIQTKITPYNQAVTQRLEEIIGNFPVTPCPGAHEIVATLREHPQVLLGLVTGNMSGLAPVKLRTAGFDPDDFKIAAYGSEGWQRSMLPPLALRRARGFAGIEFPGERIVIIGDTPGDITCAASIEARTIAVATGPYSVADLQAHGPTHTFENLSDHNTVLSAILNHNTAA